MDYLQYPYVSRMKFWKDSDATVPIRWYRCEPDAPMWDGAHRFASLYHEDRDIVNTGLGEQTDSVTAPGDDHPFCHPAAIYDPYAGQNIHAILPGQGCGPAAVWRQGGLTAVHPPLTCDDDGVPVCCKRADQACGGEIEGGCDDG